MTVTRKKPQKAKRKQRRKGRGKECPPTIVDLAHFLNLDLAKCEIRKWWWYFKLWTKIGVPQYWTEADDLKRYAELKLLVTILEEREVQPGYNTGNLHWWGEKPKDPDLINYLQDLQDEIKTVLAPLVRSSPSSVNIGRVVENIIARLNHFNPRARWVLYTDRVGILEDWHCLYDPEHPNDVTKIDSVILAQEKVLRLDGHCFVVKQTVSCGNSIADKLYWHIGRTFVDGSIARLKTCVECGKYFPAYDSKQIVCPMSECRKQHSRKGIAERVRLYRRRKQARKRLS